MPLVFYDDDCLACRYFREWAEQKKHSSGIQFKTLDGRQGIGSNDQSNLMEWVDEEGRNAKGARAMFLTIAATGGLLGKICQFLAVWPLYITFEPAYRLFAMNRHRFDVFFRRHRT